MRTLARLRALIFVVSSCFGAMHAQSQTTTTLTAVPRLVRISSVYHSANSAKPTATGSVTLAIYAAQTGGSALWQEVQNVEIDGDGHYTVVLGSTLSDGLPLELFATAEPRWLGVQFHETGETEQPRILLTSVPYALKAADAETLGGLPASAYVLNPAAEISASGIPASANIDRALKSTPRFISSGTTGFISMFTDLQGDIANSILFENGPKVGLGTTNPLDYVHVAFTDMTGQFTGYAVQNRGSGAGSYSGMLFYDQNGNLAQFQGFNNSTHEYRINNIAKNASNFPDGSISFMLNGSTILSLAGGLVGIPEAGSNGRLAVSVQDQSVFSAIFGYDGANANYGTFGYAGVWGKADGFNGIGVWGEADNNAQLSVPYGVYGSSRNTANGFAGVFDGNVYVNGSLSKPGGSFQIDHPLDPGNKYLYHSFVESPDMMNVYNGNITTDDSGCATVTLPSYFQALNRDYRYQLTVIGQFAQAIVEHEIENNSFVIRSDKPNVKVSWQVTGIRQDAWANAHRIPEEVEKPPSERGYFLHPEEHGQPETRGMEWARRPDFMKKRQEGLQKKQSSAPDAN